MCQRAVNFVRHMLLAVQFFTRIPVQGRVAAWVGFAPEAQRRSLAHLPAVGWVVGLMAAVALLGTVWALGGLSYEGWEGANSSRPRTGHWAVFGQVGWGQAVDVAQQLVLACVAAIVALAAGVWITGGLHEDGLADVADALGGGAALSQARMLEIMKDPRVGSYALITMVLSLGLKAALLALLALHHPLLGAAVLLTGHVASRIAPLVLAHTLDYVGQAAVSKTGAMTAHRLSSASLVVGLLWVLPALGLMAAVLHGLWGWSGQGLALRLLQSVALVAVLLVWLRRKLVQRLGGMTGDCLGAGQQLAQLGWLLGAALWWRD